MVKRGSIVVFMLALWVWGCASYAASSGYRREIAGMLPIGNGPNAVQVVPAKDSPGSGPDFVAGDILGNVFLAGSAEKNIRKFDKDGKPAFTAGIPADQITSVIPDDLGGIWMVVNVSQGMDCALYHYDGKGKLTAKVPSQRLGSERDLWYGFGPLEVICERFEGVLRVRVGKEALRISTKGKILGKAGTILEDNQGRAFAVDDSLANAIEVTRINKFGSSLSSRKIMAKRPAGIKASETRFGCVPIGMDGGANFYMMWHVQPKAKTRLKNGLNSWSDLIVQEYAADGRFLSEVNVGRAWDYENSASPSVDYNGRLYTIDFTNDSVRVMRWTPFSKLQGSEKGKRRK